MTDIRFSNGRRYHLQEGETAAWLGLTTGTCIVVCHPYRDPKLVWDNGHERPLMGATPDVVGGGGFPDGAMPGFSASKDRGDGNKRLEVPTSEELREGIIRQFRESVFPDADGGAAIETVPGGGGWFEQMWFDGDKARRSIHPLSDLLKAYPGPVWIGWDLAAPDGDKWVPADVDRSGNLGAADDGSWDYKVGDTCFRINGNGESVAVANPKAMSPEAEDAALFAGDYDGKPIINDFDVERLARKLCVAHGENPDAPRRIGGGVPGTCLCWVYRKAAAETMLRDEWAKREAWEKRRPSFYHRLDAKGDLHAKS